MRADRDLLAQGETNGVAQRFASAPAETVIAWALEQWRSRIAVCTSFQAEGVVILDMAWRIDPEVRVFTVDTGRLPQETYDLMERVRERYGIEVEVFFPDPGHVEAMVHGHGPNLFYKSVEARMWCCHVRKVEPLRRALAGLAAWITGLRRRQSVSRATISKSSTLSVIGPLSKFGTISTLTTCRPTSCIGGVTPASAVPPARARHDRGMMPGLGAGGGNRTP